MKNTSAQQKALLLFGEAAKRPTYFSQFVDSFYDEYIESRHQSLSQKFADYPSFDSPHYVGVLFTHVRAAMYVYRQLNFKRLLLATKVNANRKHSRFRSLDIEFAPNFAEVVETRCSRFVSDTSQRHAELLPTSDISKFFIPAFVRSTNHVLRHIAEDYYIDSKRLFRNRLPNSKVHDEFLRNSDLPKEALVRANKIKMLYESRGLLDNEIAQAFERYEQAITLVREPARLYGMDGVERLYLAGMELNLLQRINSLALLTTSEDAKLLSAALQKWHVAHDALLLDGLEKDRENAMPPPSALATKDLPALSSTAWINARKPKLDSAKPTLADNLPIRATISPRISYRSFARKESLTSMVSKHHKNLVTIFAVGLCVCAGGLLTAAAGVFLGNFLTAYCGVGLIAAGLSTVTLTLFQAVEIEPRCP